jgi:mannose-6-phosphate isomerase-like protein (cupin superfamily)
VRSGDVIWNPLSGEKALLVESAEESDGSRIVVDFVVEAGGFVPGGEHVHDHFAEHFEVQEGSIAFLLDGEERTLVAGDETTVAPGTWHRWWNPGEEEVRARVRVEPAMRLQEAIAMAWGLCADGHTNAEGRPSPLFGALMASRYRAELRFRQPPDAVQRLLFPPLAAIAQWRGLERTLDRYLDLQAHPSAEPAMGHLPEQVMRGHGRRG